MKKLPEEFKDDIPLGYAIFLLSNGTNGAEMIHELSRFQVDGKLFDADKLDEDFFDEGLLSSLDYLRNLLRARTEEGQQS